MNDKRKKDNEAKLLQLRLVQTDLLEQVVCPLIGHSYSRLVRGSLQKKNEQHYTTNIGK